MKLILKFSFAVILFCVYSHFVFAQVAITEIMYKPNPNSGHEWIEVRNTGSQPVDLTYSISKHWKLIEDTKEGGIKPFVGGSVLSSGGIAILAIDPATFLMDWPNWEGSLFDITSLTSLTDDYGVLSVKSAEGEIQDTVDYGLYAKNKIAYNGDKNAPQVSLQKNSLNEWVSAPPTPGSNLPTEPLPDEETEISSTNSATTTSASDSQLSNQSVSGSVSGFPVEPQIFANAGKDKTVIVGAEVTFEGKAYGLKKEPLENARFLWNFGDGIIAEGKMVLHTYKHPGDYIAVLDVASGGYGSADQLKVKAEPSPLSISSITDGTGYFIELTNKSNIDIDISSWILATGDKIFVVPKNTFVMGGKKLAFLNEVTDLPVSEGDTPELRYPNGTLAYRFGEINKPAQLPAKVVISDESDQPAILHAPDKSFLPVVEDNSTPIDDNMAAAATVPKSFPLNYIWLLGVVGISLAAIGVVFVARRFEMPDNEIEKLAREIEIVED